MFISLCISNSLLFVLTECYNTLTENSELLSFAIVPYANILNIFTKPKILLAIYWLTLDIKSYETNLRW